jgi:hypothetical protein
MFFVRTPTRVFGVFISLQVNRPGLPRGCNDTYIRLCYENFLLHAIFLESLVAVLLLKAAFSNYLMVSVIVV